MRERHLNSKGRVCRVCSSKKTSATVNVQCYFQEAPPEPGILGLFIFYKQETPPELKGVPFKKGFSFLQQSEDRVGDFVRDVCDQVRFV